MKLRMSVKKTQYDSIPPYTSVFIEHPKPPVSSDPKSQERRFRLHILAKAAVNSPTHSPVSGSKSLATSHQLRLPFVLGFISDCHTISLSHLAAGLEIFASRPANKASCPTMYPDVPPARERVEKSPIMCAHMNSESFARKAYEHVSHMQDKEKPNTAVEEHLDDVHFYSAYTEEDDQNFPLHRLQEKLPVDNHPGASHPAVVVKCFNAEGRAGERRPDDKGNVEGRPGTG
ncbi:uncharacterized protein LAESUDRAFT_762475 [Laetiporus sulphureus 93-53]|uniref:Uncharacterized protein n=1 Tax=Laetiporus sulphureus 93-53 TaxID=1314785 RepID=A0A165CHI0_9APHY|nr:uncharacterized protein LAESUDRAFT_762475 [Laetiporus sulphureus 93-53]KZT02823.1 hypothetical protein LAESUDRAFT_762475 [Laetiporus sulphureus 93-53]